MATSDRGMLDVERFDLEPERPPFHGLLGDVTSAELGGLTTKQKVPYVLRILDPASLTDRAAASLVEVKETRLDVAAARVRRRARRRDGGQRRAADRARRAHGLRALLRRSRRADRRRARRRRSRPRPPAAAGAAGRRRPDAGRRRRRRRRARRCASSSRARARRRPAATCSRGASRRDGDVIRAWVDPTRSSLLDFRDRAALLALGAALEAAMHRRAARSASSRGRGRPRRDGPVWELALERATDARDEHAVEVLWQRCCNRRTGASPPIADAELARLARRGAPLDTRVVAGDALARPRRRPGRAGPRALPVAPAARAT